MARLLDKVVTNKVFDTKLCPCSFLYSQVGSFTRMYWQFLVFPVRTVNHLSPLESTLNDRTAKNELLASRRMACTRYTQTFAFDQLLRGRVAFYRLLN